MTSVLGSLGAQIDLTGFQLRFDAQVKGKRSGKSSGAHGSNSVGREHTEGHEFSSAEFIEKESERLEPPTSARNFAHLFLISGRCSIVRSLLQGLFSASS